MKKSSDDQYTATETKKRMDDAVRRALSTPHKTNQAVAAKKRKARKVKRPGRATP